MIKNKIFVNGRENYLFLIFILALFFNDSIAYSQTQSPSQRANYNLPLTLHFSQNFFLNDGPEYERITGGYELMGAFRPEQDFQIKYFFVQAFIFHTEKQHIAEPFTRLISAASTEHQMILFILISIS